MMVRRFVAENGLGVRYSCHHFAWNRRDAPRCCVAGSMRCGAARRIDLWFRQDHGGALSTQEESMARSPNGQAISATRRTRAAQRRLTAFLRKAKKHGDLNAWRRAKAVLGCMKGKRVIMVMILPSSINCRLQFAQGMENF